ncbi:Ubiquitin-like-specific protease 2 [Lasiodiplodia hormozganensis]|uniref:Ubiquitin-like-specific protease 2 n=1 Tax=Lasiodiplodia hormozganensis TaxID=869390 RepID=A0AA39Z441_9PEZI|nr:Ubiquitin-like-specific protease 2 [Lasiodiplodia hormozganensis]
MDALLEEIALSQDPRKPPVKNKLFGQRLPNDELRNDDSHPGSQPRLAQGHGRKEAKGGAGSGQSHDVRFNPTATAATIDGGSEDELSQEIPRALPKQREKHIRNFDAEEQMTSPYFTESVDVDHHQTHPRQPPGSDMISSKADIKPTMFASKNSGNTSLQRLSKKTSTPRRSWPLKFFRVPHSPPMSDVHLVWDHNKKHFAVHGLEGPIPIGNGVACVEGSKVTSIVLSNDDSSAKVEIRGPIIGDEVYKRFMEFTSNKDCKDFVAALSTTVKPFFKSSNKERTQDKANTNAAANGRPRPDSRLISQMQVDPSRAESSTRTSRASRATESLDMTTSRTLANTRRTRASDGDYENSKIEYLEIAAQHESSWPQMDFPKQWKQPLVYPPTGRQRAQVDWADLLKLEDGEFLNDSIISFYMTWAAKQAEERGNLRPDKVYWFNTYFYSTLTKQVKGHKGINYAGVQRWTSKVDIFSYDYVVVPINEDQHWYLAIICNLPALAKKVQHQEPEAEIEDITEKKDLPRNGLAAQVHKALSEKPESPSDSTKESGGMGEAMEVDQPVRIDGATGGEKLNSERDEGETRMTTPQPITDDAQTETLDEIKAVPNGQDDTSKLSPGGKKGRKKQGPPSRKLDPEQPVIIMLDSLELTHPKTTKNLKAYLVEEGEAKRGMDIDMKTLQGTTAKCIPTQDNFCDCGIFVCLYFEKFINDADNFVHKILRREMDKTRDWPDICPPKTRRDILGLLTKLEEEQSRERDEQRKKRKEEKRKLLEGKGDESSVSIRGQSPPSTTVEPERASKPPSGSPPPALVSTKAAEPRTPTPPPRARTPKTGRNPVVVIQASPVKCQGSSTNLVLGKSPRKRTLPAETTDVQKNDVAMPSTDNRKRRESPFQASDNDLAMEDAGEPVQSIERRHPEWHEQGDRAGHSRYERVGDWMDLEIEQDRSEVEVPDSQPEPYELAAREKHNQWELGLKEPSGNNEGQIEVRKQRSPSQRRQQQKKRKTTPMEIIEIDDSQP